METSISTELSFVLCLQQANAKRYLKVGLIEVGRRRNARLIDGQYRDDIRMDILKAE